MASREARDSDFDWTLTYHGVTGRFTLWTDAPSRRSARTPVSSMEDAVTRSATLATHRMMTPLEPELDSFTDPGPVTRRTLLLSLVALATLTDAAGAQPAAANRRTV